MATSSRQSALFGVNDWKAIYQTFRDADFRSYDYETLRKSFIDYLRIYYPETYNDYIESSEFVALLDVMAFMGQGLAFRNDLNARENFIDTAERRDSVIKLAELVSYTPKRNLAAQGYLKVISIQTTQNIIDLNGINLSNIPILWNDPANSSWLEQFNTIINASLINTQKIGRPGNVSDILGVLTSEYSMQIPSNALPVVPFTTQVDGVTMNFELTSMTSLGEDYLYEIPPAPTGKFNILYRNDRLGFGSADTGFFFYFKQGRLSNFDFILEQQIANQTVNIDQQGINNEDTWLYQLDTNNNTSLPWKKVASVYADAYLQTESSQKKTFSVTSRFNDQVTYVFGDGVFSEIPVGTFRAYVRSGNGLTFTIDPNEMQNINVAFTYISRLGRPETLTVGLQLQTPVSNAQSRESIPSIKQRAPTRYYTQNRMVNGEDYNNFPYTLYSSIIKSKAVNRSSIGVSKNLDLLDPTGKYSSINTFGSDGALWQNTALGSIAISFNTTPEVISFITDRISTILGAIRTNQYYIQNYPRYTIQSSSNTDPNVYWNLSVVNSNSENGYFYINDSGIDYPVSLGTLGGDNLKYITAGALIKLTAPSGFYFDNNNRLVAGLPGPSNSTFIWTTVLNVVGDGNNQGEGNFNNGTGPVTLNGYVPNNVILTEVIPVFDNSLSADIIREIVLKIELLQDFSLVFDNSLLAIQERWFIKPFNDSNWFVRFQCVDPANNRYIVTYRSLRYYFGSVEDIRFALSPGELVYDPFTGKIIQDFVNVLSTNTQPNSSNALGKDTKISIVGLTTESDGYINDFQVQVSSIDVNNNQLILNPDFFNELTGYVENANNQNTFVFFELVQNPITLETLQIIPSTDVVFQYKTKDEIELVKYDYAEGQLFYATNENIFYKTQQDINVLTPSYVLYEPKTNNNIPKYYIEYGRQGFTFQYRHNSNNTTRIDPATTNIIDLYVVTLPYYNAYQRYIQDSTNTIPEPNRPTINDLTSEFPKINDYKMLSDSVILNSVVFKPLFGPKADEALRGTIKVIKDSTTDASDSEIRSAVLTAMNNYFNINNWNFGDTFYFSELSAYLHDQCGDLISSAVLVSNDPEAPFGTLYEIKCAPYEIFVNAATADDVAVIAALTPDQLQVG